MSSSYPDEDRPSLSARTVVETQRARGRGGEKTISVLMASLPRGDNQRKPRRMAGRSRSRNIVGRYKKNKGVQTIAVLID